MRVSSDRKPTSNKKHPKKHDIRAGRQIKPWDLGDFNWLRSLLLIAADILGLGIAWKSSLNLNRGFSPLPPELDWGEFAGLTGLFWAFAGVLVIGFASQNFYRGESQWRNYVKQAQIISGVYLSSLVVCYFYNPMVDPPRSLFFPVWIGSVIVIIGMRLLLTLLLDQFPIARIHTPVFIIATSDRLPYLANIIEKRTGYKVVGVLTSSLANTSHSIQSIINSGAKEVIAEGLPETQLASQLYWQLRNVGIGLRLVPSSLMLLHRRGTPEIFASMPMIRIESSLLGNWEYIFKRCLDLVAAWIGLIVLSPLFVAIAIAIKTSSRGSVFYTQDRIGLHGQSFRMWKFRSMFMDADRRQSELEHLNKSTDGVMFKIERDPRIIPIGHFLRCTSLDELPQLFNVLLGQMSLVGPRPLPVRDVAKFTDWHHTRHLVMPGITGLWQISGRSDLDTIDDVAKLDLFYIDRWSLNFDLEILIETVRLVLFGKGAY
ncbi:sugar transferase [Pseudanabaena mucicola]|uniref:Sugar transferase n=1 Tax=Pseudanabaena mucicola FACHB-723 TaxID=2692860 RepID=A0ABR7ZZV2_9CYAN|nr:sugar transferase [Pseudanabaena mucicola]MBD2189114.1 sugar transferase [Pseudanabaena mucicola FACHB-723]